jgi:hypothetical protein
MRRWCGAMTEKVFVVDSDAKADWLKSDETRARERRIFRLVQAQLAGDGTKAGRFVTIEGKPVFIGGPGQGGGGGSAGGTEPLDFGAGGDSDWLMDDKGLNPELSGEESEALGYYKEEAYYSVNERLRAGKANAEVGSYERKLDQAIEQGELSQPLTVYRGVDGELSFGDDGFKDWGYVSTSLSSNVAEDFTGWDGEVYKIHLPKGSHAINMENYGDGREQEILLPRGSVFRPVGKYELELVL